MCLRLQKYSEAIELNAYDADCYLKRAAAFMKLEKYQGNMGNHLIWHGMDSKHIELLVSNSDSCNDRSSGIVKQFSSKQLLIGWFEE